MGYRNYRGYSSYGNKVTLGEAILTLAVLIGLIAAVESCTTPTPDDGLPYETISMKDNVDDNIDNNEIYFAPGEHIVAVAIEDPLGEPVVYSGHPGYKPIGISASAYSQYFPSYHVGYMLFENIVEVKTNATDTDINGNYIYNNFGTPVDYEITSYGENSYDSYQHIIAMPFSIEGPRTQVEPIDGYEVVGIATASYGRYAGSDAGTCILYVNTEPVKNCVDEYNCPKCGTPIEKAKVLTK